MVESILQATQYQILIQEIPVYQGEVQRAQNLDEIKTATRKVFSKLMEQVFKEDVLIIRPKVNAPQDLANNGDIELKSEMVKEVVKETEDYEVDENAFEAAHKQEI